jgi:hypothetical protein
MYAVSRVGTHHTGKRYVWRGVSDSTYRMSSSLWRLVADELERRPTEEEIRAREVQIIDAARDWGIGADQGILPTEFHIAALLQHEGVQSRLLDVTSNPMTALWFACSAQQDRPGVLLAIEVSSWRTITTTETYQHTWAGVGGTGQIEIATSSNPDPILVVPKNTTGRLAAQEGLFITSRTTDQPVVGGVDGLNLTGRLQPPGRSELETMLSIGRRGQGHPRTLPLVAIVVPSRVKMSMMGHLETTYSRSRQALFPDVGGFHAAFSAGEVGLPMEP